MPPSNLEEEHRVGAATSQLFLHEVLSIANVFIQYLREMTARASHWHTLQYSPTNFLFPNILMKTVNIKPEMLRVGNYPAS